MQLIDNRSVLIQVMACPRMSDKPLPEPMVTNSQKHMSPHKQLIGPWEIWMKF